MEFSILFCDSVILTHNAPAVAVLLSSSLDAFVAEAAVEGAGDQGETGGCKIYMFHKLEILPVVFPIFILFVWKFNRDEGTERTAQHQQFHLKLFNG